MVHHEVHHDPFTLIHIHICEDFGCGHGAGMRCIGCGQFLCESHAESTTCQKYGSHKMVWPRYDPLKDPIYEASKTIAQGAKKIDAGAPHL